MHRLHLKDRRHRRKTGRPFDIEKQISTREMQWLHHNDRHHRRKIALSSDPAQYGMHRRPLVIDKQISTREMHGLHLKDRRHRSKIDKTKHHARRAVVVTRPRSSSLVVTRRHSSSLVVNRRQSSSQSCPINPVMPKRIDNEEEQMHSMGERPVWL